MLPDPSRGSVIARFLRGNAYLLTSFGQLTRGGLLKYALMPMAISLLLLVGLVIGVSFMADDVLRLFWTSPDDAWVVVYWLALALVWVVLLVLAYGVFVVLSGVLAGPFNDALSEKTEALELGDAATTDGAGSGMIGETARSVGHAIKTLFLFIAVSIPLLLLNLIPLVGNLLYALLGGTAASYFAAMDYIDGPASRRGYSHRQKRRTVTRNMALFMGFGTAVTLCLLVPVVNFLVLPAAVVGGTRLFIHLEAHQRTGLLLALLASSSLALSGCGGGGEGEEDADLTTDTVVDFSSDVCPVDPELCLREPGILKRSGSEVRLIPAPVGGESLGYFQVSNGAPADSNTILIVERVTVDGSPYISVADDSGDVAPFALEPGQSGVIALRLAPESTDYQCPDATGDPDFCGTMSIFHNDTLNSPALLPIRVDTSSGVLEVNPTSVVFEDSLQDQESVITLRNVGFGALEILDARFASPLEGLFAEGPALPVQLGPTETTEWTIRYQPISRGTGIGTLRFQTSSPITSEAVVVAQVGGVGVPQIELSATALDLRGAGPGRQVTRTLTITNTGAQETLEVQPSIVPSSASGDFTVTENGEDVLGGLIGVQAQRSTDLTVTYAPTGEVTDAVLFLETNDPVTPELNVELMTR